jgi:Mrp family chromosome partitioning ATPase
VLQSQPQVLVKTVDRITEALARAQHNEFGEKPFGTILSDKYSREAFVPTTSEAPKFKQTIVHTYSNPQLANEGSRVQPVPADLAQTQPSHTTRRVVEHILHTLEQREWRTLAFVSPGHGPARAGFAAEFATLLSREFGKNCLLIDADLQNPSQHTWFQVPAGPGLGDYLAKRTRAEGLAMATGIEGLSVIAAGASIANSATALGSSRMTALLAELKLRFHDTFFLIDLPALSACNDALECAPYVDGLLLVDREADRNNTELAAAREKLAGFNTIGLVLDDVQGVSQSASPTVARTPRAGGFFARLFRRN